MNEFDSATTVGQLVAEQPGRGRVFERYAIDYCCGGKQTLTQACAATGVDLQTIAGELEAADRAVEARPEGNLTQVPVPALVEHIESIHHGYLKRELPRLAMLVEKIATVHGGRHPELLEVRRIFLTVKNELDTHLMKEERVLFPMCRQLAEVDGSLNFHCGSVQNPIRMMEFEHDGHGEQLRRLRELTHGFEVPADGCNTYRVTMDGLREFEADMHTHIHKENNILFPRVLELSRRPPATH